MSADFLDTNIFVYKYDETDERSSSSPDLWSLTQSEQEPPASARRSCKRR